MQIINSKVKNDIIKKIISKDVKSNMELFDYATCKCGIDGMIAVAHFFTPDIIHYNDCILIKRFLNCNTETEIKDYIDGLEKQYGDKTIIEKMVNTWSVGDFFVGESDTLYDDDQIIEEFAKCLQYYWKRWVESLFPNIEVIVDIEDNSMGEYGKCITLYTKR